MSGRGSWTRRLDRLQAALPDPPAGSPYWHDSLARIGSALRLADREPDYAGAITAYGKLRPPYGGEARRLHDHLFELVGRAADKTPPCSADEFADLAAWLAETGGALPTTNGWKNDLDLGDGTTATLSDLTWRAGRGPTAGGSGKLAETLRKLRSRYSDTDRLAQEEGMGETAHVGQAQPWGGASVVRDDAEPT